MRSPCRPSSRPQIDTIHLPEIFQPLIYCRQKNNKGPITDPCRTPNVTSRIVGANAGVRIRR